MKAMKLIISITIPIFLILLFANILTTKAYLTVSKGLYESHSEITYDQDYAIDHIMGYLNYEYDDLYFGATPEDDGILLRDIEIRHMVDVKNLYTNLRIIGLASLIIGVFLSYVMYKKDKVELYRTYRNMYVGPLFFIMFVGGYILIDFNTAFTAFHEIFFTNDDWILYSTDALIQLLPSEFWMVSGIIILVLFSVSQAVIFGLFSKLYNRETAK
jgi:integral membrane protein (TIGR01906 family)